MVAGAVEVRNGMIGCYVSALGSRISFFMRDYMNF